MKKSLLFPILVCIFPMLSACNEHFVAGLAEGMARGLNKKATSTSEIAINKSPNVPVPAENVKFVS